MPLTFPEANSGPADRDPLSDDGAVVSGGSLGGVSAHRAHTNGVSWIEETCKWQAWIEKDGSSSLVGHFANEVAATHSYNAAAARLRLARRCTGSAPQVAL